MPYIRNVTAVAEYRRRTQPYRRNRRTSPTSHRKSGRRRPAYNHDCNRRPFYIEGSVVASPSTALQPAGQQQAKKPPVSRQRRADFAGKIDILLPLRLLLIVLPYLVPPRYRHKKSGIFTSKYGDNKCWSAFALAVKASPTHQCVAHIRRNDRSTASRRRDIAIFATALDQCIDGATMLLTMLFTKR